MIESYHVYLKSPLESDKDPIYFYIEAPYQLQKESDQQDALLNYDESKVEEIQKNFSDLYPKKFPSKLTLKMENVRAKAPKDVQVLHVKYTSAIISASTGRLEEKNFTKEILYHASK